MIYDITLNTKSKQRHGLKNIEQCEYLISAQYCLGHQNSGELPRHKRQSLAACTIKHNQLYVRKSITLNIITILFNDESLF